ncbi:MAG: heavy-metal-associated domain-containing protein [Gemmatimonadaceae bacterium]
MITTLYLDGMTTVHCARALFTSLARIDGIATAEVTIGRAIIDHDGRATESALVHAATAVGFTVREVIVERRRLAVRDEE